MSGKKIKQAGNGSCTVHIVIAVYKYFLFIGLSTIDPVHGDLHVFHCPWVVEIAQLRTEECFCFFVRFNISIQEKPAKNRIWLLLLAIFAVGARFWRIQAAAA